MKKIAKDIGSIDDPSFAGPDALRLLGPGGIVAGEVAIGFGILPAANPFAIFNDARTATRLPGGARLRVGLLLLRCPRRRCANDVTAIDDEVGRLAGSKRAPGGGRRVARCRRGGGICGLRGTRTISVVRRRLLRR